MKKYFFIFIIGIFYTHHLFSQVVKNSNNPLLKDGMYFRLNEEGTHYIRMTFLNQTWIRFNESNPGSTVFGNAKSETFDIGLRRTRLQLFGQLTDRVFFYMQFGQNNFNYTSPRKLGAFFHDVTMEYAFHKRSFSLGAGLTGWTGYSRFSSPGVASILGLDAPLFEQATNDINDQFLRKLSIFAKGKISKLDYRVVLSTPFTIDPSNFAASGNAVPTALGSQTYKGTNANISVFSTKPPEVVAHGYIMWQFLDEETNLIPYTTGTYLGKKRVFNIGAGFLHQSNAMWYKTAQGDTVQTAIQLFSADLYYDSPLNKEKGTAISFYGGYFQNNFGTNFVRNLGVMNPANGTIANKASFNGAGSAFPMEGTGNTVYIQAGYKFRDKLLGSHGTLLPYASFQTGNYQRFADRMNVYEAGVNWLINGHNSKLTLNYQNRPIFNADANGDLRQTDRKGMLVLQWQFLLN